MAQARGIVSGVSLHPASPSSRRKPTLADTPPQGVVAVPPQAEPLCVLPEVRLHPLMIERYYNSPAKKAVFDCIQRFLAVPVLGFQQGHGTPDLIMFAAPTGSNLAVPCSIMLEPEFRARQIVQDKIEANRKQFAQASNF